MQEETTTGVESTPETTGVEATPEVAADTEAAA